MAEKTNPVPMGAQAPKSRFFTPYVLIWAALASGSLMYLALLATQPALVASFLGAGPPTETADVAAGDEEKRAMVEAVGEVRLLRESVDRFRDDLQELKAQVSSQGERGGDLTARMAALEASVTAAASAPADPQKIAAEKRAAAKQAKAAEAAAKAAPAAKKEASLETGSVANEEVAVAFGPAVVTPAKPAKATALSKQLGLQIASGPSVDSLRLSWTLLSERHSGTLRALQPRYTIGNDGTGTTYDLVVGPLNSAAEATRLCQELSAMATPCSIGVYTGDVL